MNWLKNWREVLTSLKTSSPVSRLAFRNGAVIHAPHACNHLDFLFCEIWVDRTYNPPGFEIENGDVVIDVGANIGVFSCFAAMSAQNVKVLAYEPFPGNAALLRSNVASVPGADIRVFESAVCGKCAVGMLRSDTTNWIAHSLSEQDNDSDDGIPVTTVSLDEILAGNGIDRCNLLKLDCEGSEYEILANASPSTMDRVEQIVGEYHCTSQFPTCDDAENEIAALLRNDFSKLEIVRDNAPSAQGGLFFATR